MWTSERKPARPDPVLPITERLDVQSRNFTTDVTPDNVVIGLVPYHGWYLLVRVLQHVLIAGFFGWLVLDAMYPAWHLFPRRRPLQTALLYEIGAPILVALGAYLLWQALVLLYRFAGSETVTIDALTLRIRRSLLGVSNTRTYDMEDIRYISVQGWIRPYDRFDESDFTEADSLWWGGWTGWGLYRVRRHWWVFPADPGGLRFVYNGSVVRFGTGLREGEAAHLLSIIGQLWPRLLSSSPYVPGMIRAAPEVEGSRP